MDKNQALDMIMSLPADELAKAVKDAKGLEGIRIIKDLWEDEHLMAVPERNDTKTGPAMHSSGSGVDKAVAEYSHPANQVGLTEAYDKFAKDNVEGWGKMHSAFKSLQEEFKAGFAAIADTMSKALPVLKKGEEEHKEEEKKEEHAEEMHKDPDPDPDPDPKHKSLTEKVAAMWDALGDLEEACAKAEEEHDEKEEKKEHEHEMEKARQNIAKAETALETLEAQKDAMYIQKAQTFINLGWNALAKATGLSSYDLHGYGNQEDAQVPGDSTSDRSKKDLKAARAKAKYYGSKAERLEKSLGLAPLKKDPDPDPDPDPKKDMKKDPDPEPDPDPKMKKDPDPDPDPDPKSKAEMLKLKTELEKSEASMKAMRTRIDEINQRVEQVAGHKMTPMVPVFIKSAGLASESVVDALNDRISAAEENGELNEDQSGIARSLVQRYMAAKRGHIGLDKVNRQLDLSPVEVQNFFSHLESGN